MDTPENPLHAPLLAELRAPDGHVWRLYLDGRTEGFPVGTSVANPETPLVQFMIGVTVLKRAKMLVTISENLGVPLSECNEPGLSEAIDIVRAR